MRSEERALAGVVGTEQHGEVVERDVHVDDPHGRPANAYPINFTGRNMADTANVRATSSSSAASSGALAY